MELSRSISCTTFPQETPRSSSQWRNESSKNQPQAEAGGAAAAGPAFVIVNERVLQAKLLALMAIRGEIAGIEMAMEEVRAREEPPYYFAKPPLIDHGLQASEHLKPLKESYFASRALAGHYNIAKAVLKRIDRSLYKSLLQSFPMTGMEEQTHLVELAKDYQQQYPQHKSLTLAEITQQLIGLVAFLDFQDKKRVLTPEDLVAVSNDRSRLLKRLKRQKIKFKNLFGKHSLLGAEFVDFPRLRGLRRVEPRIGAQDLWSRALVPKT